MLNHNTASRDTDVQDGNILLRIALFGVLTVIMACSCPGACKASPCRPLSPNSGPQHDYNTSYGYGTQPCRLSP
ncbi:hypothetical protein HZ326_20214 [Fusarium oxysporum f. sp. albedinis]|nr:hypothetical protein HZ326_20214 [Fusarium oxysporum f. sp. albedinis]